MIDYRPVIKQYIKDKAIIVSDNIFDATLTFKQPNTDYASFYVLNEDEQSYQNNALQEVNGADPTLLDETYDPLTTVIMEIDVRGSNSYTKSRNLHKSFGTINNKKVLSDQGVFFMNVSGLTPLPQVKNTKSEEGYIFELTFSFDNSFIETSIIADTVLLKSP